MLPINIAPENDAAMSKAESSKCHLAGTVLHMTCIGSGYETILSAPEVNIFVALCKRVKEVQ